MVSQSSRSFTYSPGIFNAIHLLISDLVATLFSTSTILCALPNGSKKDILWSVNWAAVCLRKSSDIHCLEESGLRCRLFIHSRAAAAASLLSWCRQHMRHLFQVHITWQRFASSHGHRGPSSENTLHEIVLTADAEQIQAKMPEDYSLLSGPKWLQI